MAVNPTQPAARNGGGGSRMPFGRALLVIGSLILAAALVPMARLILVGLAPTLIAYLMAQLVERGGERHAVLCVGICNLAGLIPFVVVAFKSPGGAALGDAGVMLALLAAYGSAAFGWVVVREESGDLSCKLASRPRSGRERALRTGHAKARPASAGEA